MQTTIEVTTDQKRQLQAILLHLDYYEGEVDGRWGRLSIDAMASWQRDNAYAVVDGIPTWEQMVELGVVKPIPRPRSKVGQWVLNLLLSKGLPLFVSLLPKPKVNPAMSNLLLAIGRINKAWVAGLVAFVCSNILLYFFGIDVTADTQALISTVLFTVISAFATWLIPNVPPAVEGNILSPAKLYGEGSTLPDNFVPLDGGPIPPVAGVGQNTKQDYSNGAS